MRIRLDSPSDVRAIKQEYLCLAAQERDRREPLRSAHLTEALARAFGFGSNAALLAALKRDAVDCPVDTIAFAEFVERSLANPSDKAVFRETDLLRRSCRDALPWYRVASGANPRDMLLLAAILACHAADGEQAPLAAALEDAVGMDQADRGAIARITVEFARDRRLRGVVRTGPEPVVDLHKGKRRAEIIDFAEGRLSVLDFVPERWALSNMFGDVRIGDDEAVAAALMRGIRDGRARVAAATVWAYCQSGCDSGWRDDILDAAYAAVPAASMDAGTLAALLRRHLRDKPCFDYHEGAGEPRALLLARRGKGGTLDIGVYGWSAHHPSKYAACAGDIGIPGDPDASWREQRDVWLAHVDRNADGWAATLLAQMNRQPHKVLPLP